MKRRPTGMLISLLIVMLAHGLYRTLICPWLIPSRPQLLLAEQPNSSAAPETNRVVDALRDQLASLLPADSWELAGAEVLHSEEVTLLMRKHQQLADGQLEVRPVTVLFYPQGRRAWDPATSPPPIVLRATEGAVLQFDQPIDLHRGKIGRPIGGQLVGQVHIYRAETPAVNGKPGQPRFDLMTSNLQIDATKIWTPQPVEFRYGESYGRGRDLILSLDDLKEADTQPWTTWRTFELVHLEHLRLAGPWADILDKGLPPDQTSTAPIDVTCAGSFRIDNRLELMTLEDQVSIRRDVRAGVVDSMTCDRLDVHYQMQTPAGAKRPTLVPGRVTAKGTPASVQIASRQLAAQGERFEYQPQRRELVLESSTGAWLQNAEHRLAARRIQYEMGLGQELGKFAADGPGEYHGTLRGQPILAQWQGTLRFGPSDGMRRLALQGGMKLALGESGGIAADELELWLMETARPGSAPHAAQGQVLPATWLAAAAAPAAAALPAGDNASPQANSASTTNPTSTTNPLSKMPGLLPHRLAARGNVEFRFQQLRGNTGELSAEFSGSPPDQSAGATGGALSANGLAGLGSAAAGSAVATASLPSAGQTTSSNARGGLWSGGGAGGANTGSSLQLSGKQMRLQIDRSKGLRHAEVIDEVEIATSGPTPQGSTAWSSPASPFAGTQRQMTLYGERLDVDVSEQQLARGVLQGNPARLTSGQIELVAAQMELDQAQNQIVIPGQGEMKVPLVIKALGSLNGLSPSAASSATPSAVAASQPGTAGNEPGVGASETANTPELAFVRWQNGLHFNGSVLRAVDNVWIQTSQQRVHISDQLEMQLAQGISLARPPQQAGGFEVRWIRGFGKIAGDSRTRNALGEFAWERFEVGSFQADQQTGEVEANGPGWIISVRPARGQGLPGQPQFASQSGSPPGETEAGLRYMRLDFADRLVGNLFRKTAEFQGNVRGIAGPVQAWEETVVAQHPSQLPEGGAMMRSDVLSIAQLPELSGTGAPPLWGLMAIGEAAVATPKLTARGDRISYDQQKELLVMEGDSRRPATMVIRKPGTSSENQVSARKIKMWQNPIRTEFEDFQFDSTGLSPASPK